MAWLDDWVRHIGALPVDAPELEGDHITSVARQQLADVSRLVGDTCVRRRLTALYASKSRRAKSNADAAQAAVKKFLAMSALACASTTSAPPTNRSDVISDLESLVEAIATVSRELKRQGRYIGYASYVSYLQERAAANNPPGYSQHRHGWGSAIGRKDSVVEILNCLKSDIQEEAALRRQALAARRQTGGKLRALHPLIGNVGGLSQALGGALGQSPSDADPELVAAVINCVRQPVEPLAADTVRKRFSSAARRKSHS